MEGETKLSSVGHLKKGNYVVIEGVACIVKDTQTSRPGKHGHAKVRLSATGILDGKLKVIVMPGHDNIEVPVIDKRTANVLSITGNMANIMDIETYETFDIEIPSEFTDDIKEGSNILYWIILKDKVIKQVKSE
jgi:translation initiation factor 5A